jgi:hypothetical protein
MLGVSCGLSPDAVYFLPVIFPLAGRPTAGHQTLDLGILVRIQARQPAPQTGPLTGIPLLLLPDYFHPGIRSLHVFLQGLQPGRIRGYPKATGLAHFGSLFLGNHLLQVLNGDTIDLRRIKVQNPLLYFPSSLHLEHQEVLKERSVAPEFHPRSVRKVFEGGFLGFVFRRLLVGVRERHFNTPRPHQFLRRNGVEKGTPRAPYQEKAPYKGKTEPGEKSCTYHNASIHP